MTDTVIETTTHTTNIEESMVDLLDALLKEQTDQSTLIERMRQELTSAQAHNGALLAEAERIARALLTLRGQSNRHPDALLAERRARISREE